MCELKAGDRATYIGKDNAGNTTLKTGDCGKVLSVTLIGDLEFRPDETHLLQGGWSVEPQYLTKEKSDE